MSGNHQKPKIEQVESRFEILTEQYFSGTYVVDNVAILRDRKTGATYMFANRGHSIAIIPIPEPQK